MRSRSRRISTSPTISPALSPGRRRFLLFPPEQTANLYPGPMDVTPANVPISMVAMDDRSFDAFRVTAKLSTAALVAELEPGDAIYIPYLWWHGVQSLGRFNVLVNYWWQSRRGCGALPLSCRSWALPSALFRDMPPEHRKAWRALYDHYVFQTDGDPMEALAPRTAKPSGQSILSG